MNKYRWRNPRQRVENQNNPSYYNYFLSISHLLNFAFILNHMYNTDVSMALQGQSLACSPGMCMCVCSGAARMPFCHHNHLCLPHTWAMKLRSWVLTFNRVRVPVGVLCRC